MLLFYAQPHAEEIAVKRRMGRAAGREDAFPTRLYNTAPCRGNLPSSGVWGRGGSGKDGMDNGCLNGR